MVFYRLGKLVGAGSSHVKEDKHSGQDEETRSREASASAKKKAREGSSDDKVHAASAPTNPSAAAGASAAPGDRRGGSGVPARATAGLSVNDFISKTKNQQRQGVKPSGPELIAYAKYLGIDPVADHDLLWLAVEALEAPLPSDWTEHFDSADRVFYYHATTRVSSWTHPMEQTYRDTYKTIVNFRNASMAPQERADKLQVLQNEVTQMEDDVHRDIAKWTEHTDEQGNRFYFNREERQSTWTDPRPAMCQVLYLKMKMLRLLQSGSGATSGFAQSGFTPSAASTDIKARRKESKGMEEAAAKDSMFSNEYDDGHSTTKPTGASRLSGSNRSGTFEATERIGRVDRSNGSFAEEFPNGRSSPTASNSSPRGSDADSDDDRKRRKKKKKDKKKKDKEYGQLAMPPVHSGQQSMMTSASEPSIGKLGLGGDQYDSLGSFGRERVKAGIRLEPIGLGGGGGEGGGGSNLFSNDAIDLS